MTDSFTMALIGIGAGLSPSLSMTSCLLVLVAYLMLTVLSVIEAKVCGVMRISYGRVGPTEFRIFLLALIAMLYAWPEARLEAWGLSMGAYDAMLYALAAPSPYSVLPPPCGSGGNSRWPTRRREHERWSSACSSDWRSSSC